MAQFMNNDLEYLVEDLFDMDDFDDVYGRGVSGGDQQRSAKQKDDTSASEYRKGKDMQGIPWERLNYNRDQCREMRLKQYKNYESLSQSHEGLEKECKVIDKRSNFYDFHFNTRVIKSTIVHFQLRNLLWATSRHDLYMMQNYSIMHWSSMVQDCNEVLNVAGQIVPSQKTSGAQPLSRVQVSTMAVKDSLLVAGGFQGELICKDLNRPGVAFCTNVTNNDNSITNAVDIYQSCNGATQILAANNDCIVRIFDTERFALRSRFSFPWSVNNASVSLDGKLLAVVGDSTDCLISDPQSGKEIATLKGHLDYSFSSAWHPEGRILATGNQDSTCRLWDVRKTSESLAVLKGRIGAVRGLKFSSDGRFLAMAEPADFVHIFDAWNDFSSAQEIDLFGEIAGVSFSPDGESLFISIADRTYGSLLEFRRRHQYNYLDSYL